MDLALNALTKMKNKTLMAAVMLVCLAGLVTAPCPAGNAPEVKLCKVICCLHNHLLPVAQAIAALMFVYGGAKYAYSADDPGGRKQGKSISVNAIIGLLIVIMSQPLITNIVGSAATCLGETCQFS